MLHEVLGFYYLNLPNFKNRSELSQALMVIRKQITLVMAYLVPFDNSNLVFRDTLRVSEHTQLLSRYFASLLVLINVFA